MAASGHNPWSSRFLLNVFEYKQARTRKRLADHGASRRSAKIARVPKRKRLKTRML
jgi:hypothetical protein